MKAKYTLSKQRVILLILVILILGFGAIVSQLLLVKQRMIFNKEKGELVEFFTFQLEMLSFCINETDYPTIEEFTDDFIRFKTEQIINLEEEND